MTYVSKKEKVFDLPQQEDSSTSLSVAETKLKRFPSVSDRRAWVLEENQRYQHLYGLVNGSESNISKSTSFKYIPFDVLLAILMAEKDAFIQELLEKQEENKSGGAKANVLYKSDGFEDSDDDRDALIRKDAEVVALKNKIAGLESELEDYRETLTKAMNKLESMDTIMSENNLLKEKIKCSEETIMCLEKTKEELERELQFYRSYYSSAEDLEAKEKYIKEAHWDGGDCGRLGPASSEREVLLQQVEELQKELETAKSNAAEIEILKKISETTSMSLDEICKENECYKKKLETMKCLEKHIEELKKQAHTLTQKYKKESQKANDQLKQMNMNAKELQMLREERDRLQMRVTELMTYENQYLSLSAKLHQVELIIDENEMLNKKMVQLDRLEVENEQLKIRIEQLKNAEIQAVEDKETIMQLQCAVAEQEEEIRRMLKHIEDMSKEYVDFNELHSLQNELEEKNEKLKKYEKQLDEIPVLESEIEQLKNKLQKCIDDFKADKDLLRRLQEELEACRKRCHELEEMAPLCRTEVVSSGKAWNGEDEPAADGKSKQESEKPEFVEKGENTDIVEVQETESQSEEIQQESKWTEVIDENFAKVQILEEQNQNLKNEVARLTQKLSKIDLDELLSQTNDLKLLLNAKDEKIKRLSSEVNSIRKELQRYEKVKQNLEEEVELLNMTTSFLKEELSLKEDYLNELQDSLTIERKEKQFAKDLIKTLEDRLEAEKDKNEVDEAKLKLLKEEANLAKQQIYAYFSEKVDHLSGMLEMSRTLNKELELENRMLSEGKDYSENVENKNLKNLIVRLRSEVEVLKKLSKPELEAECTALQQQVQTLLKETDGLIEEIKDLKSALETEKNEKDVLEKEVVNLQAELTACVASGNEILGREMSRKEALISELRDELANVRSDLENSINETQTLKERSEKLMENVDILEAERTELKNQLNTLQSREIQLNEIIKELEEKEQEYFEKAKNFEEVAGTLENVKEELAECKKSEGTLQEKVTELEEVIKAKEEELKTKEKNLKTKEEDLRTKEEDLRTKEGDLKTKEEELETTKKALAEAKNELNRISSELEVLKGRLVEKEAGGEPDISDLIYQKDLEEKYALEETLRKLENEVDEFKTKIEECKVMEEEMANLRKKRDGLLEKMAGFEREIDNLKQKLIDFENLKNELEALKTDKTTASDDLEVSKLYHQVLEQKSLIENIMKENESLKEELGKVENLMEVYKNLQKTIPGNPTPPTMEFYTPPALLSPHSVPATPELTAETIPLESHKKEVSSLETMYEEKIKCLKQTNSERLKKLTEHHEKEAKVRTKSFYESINSIKTSYESDIKKLVEKHKVSIMRLQGLHEDEVQELNTTYETQMEAMQTQNENLINDLRTEAAEKYKQLREQHNRDIRELARKYEELMREKEEKLLEEKKVENTNDINEAHKQAVENLTQFYQKSIVDLEEKHAQELKKCKKNNLKRLELMKNKYEALLAEERKKYEEQLEELLMRLKNGGQEGENLGNKSDSYSSKKTSISNTRLEFHEVLQKILNEGLECLTFEELILVHAKTCFVPQDPVGDVGGGEFPEGYGCKHKMLMTAEKEELLKRIFTLEHDIVIKQLETHEAIVNMEAAEICRIQELKNALCTAQQKNVELKRLLSDQSKQEMNLKIDRYMSDKQASLHETFVMEKVKELEKEKAEKKRLEEELQKERANMKNLAAAVEAEKERYLIQRKRDAEYVESMRQRLQEALNHEQMMETQLEYERKLRARLEAEIQESQSKWNVNLNSINKSPLHIGMQMLNNKDQSEMAIESKQNRSKSKRRTRLKSINN